MDKTIIKFDGNEIEKYEFHQCKCPILIENIDINKMVVSNKFLFGKRDFTYFIGYIDNKDIRPLCIFFSEVSICKRFSDKTKCMYFMIKYEIFFYKYMTIWEKVSSIIIKKFNSQFVYNKKYLKAEIRFNTKENFQFFYVLVILFHSVYRKDGNYYPKLFLEKFIHNFFGEEV